MKHHERDESHDNSLAITTATPKIREFVPKGEWREEGLGHYDPLSIPNKKDMEEEIVSNRWYDLADGFIFS